MLAAVLALVLVVAPASQAAGIGSCTIESPQPGPAMSPEELTVQALLPMNMQGPLSTDFGSQYGDVWMDDSTAVFYVGLAPGPISLQAATSTLHEILAGGLSGGHPLSAEQIAYLEQHTQVLAVPYSLAQIEADVQQLTGQLQAFAASNSYTVYAGIEGLWSTGAGEVSPRAIVTLNKFASDEECAQALALVESYGGAAALRRNNDGLPEAAVGILNGEGGSPSAPDKGTGPGPRSAPHRYDAPAPTRPAQLSLGDAVVKGHTLHLHVALASGRHRRLRLRLGLMRHGHRLREIRRIFTIAAHGARIAVPLPPVPLRSATALVVGARLVGSTTEGTLNVSL